MQLTTAFCCRQSLSYSTSIKPGGGSSAWLTVLPLQDLGFNLNKRDFRDAVKLRHDWPVEDIPSTYLCGQVFTVDHSLICKLGGFDTQRHNELRELEAELLNKVCRDGALENS